MGQRIKRSGGLSKGLAPGRIGEEAESLHNQPDGRPARLQPLVDSLPLPAAYVDKDHYFQYANRAYAKRFDMEAEEVVGRHVRDVLGRKEYQAVLPEISRALSGELLSFERSVKYKEGGERYLHITYEPDRSDDGEIRGFFTSIFDVTEQRRAEGALRESEERYRAFISQSSEGIWRLELEEPMPVDLPLDEQLRWAYKYGYLAECNDAMARQYGLESAGDLVGARLGDLLVEDDPNNAEFLRALVASGFRLNDAESHERDIHGNDRYFLNNFVGFMENGHVVRAWGSQRDITMSRRAEQALLESEERYRIVAETASDAIISIDDRSKILFVNSAAERIFGYPLDAMLGQPLTILMPDDMHKRHTSGLARYLKTSKRNLTWERIELPARHADGRIFPVEISFGEYKKEDKSLFIGILRDITQRRQTDNATARLASIVESSDDAIISKDLNGVIMSWNDAAERIYGFSAAEAVGHPITMLIPDERLEEEEEILWRIKSGSKVEHYETIRQRKDGRLIDVSLTISPIRDRAGQIVGASKIARDITERKENERILNENQMMLAIAMQSSRMGVWERDLATETVYWSEELETIFGLDPGEFGGSEKDFLEFIVEDHRVDVREAVERAIAEKRPYSIEFRFRRKDGSLGWMEGRGEAVYSQAGDPVRIYGIGIDITDRKRADQMLRESEERFARFMQHLPGLAWIKDTEGRYVYANTAAEKSFGTLKADLYGKTDEEVFPAETAAQFREHDRLAVEDGTGLQIVETMEDNQGILRHSIVSKFPITDPDGKLALIGGMAIDITDQKQAEDELRRRMEFDEAVMSSMGEGLFTVDSDGLVTSMNPAAEKLFGWTFEELRGRPVHDSIHYKHRDGSPFPVDECALLQVLRGGTSLVNHEDVFVRKDGTLFDVSFTSSPIREGGETTGLVVVVQDITERKRADEALERYRHLSEYASDIIWLLREDGQIVEVNQAAVDAYGYTREEMERMSVRDLRHPSMLGDIEKQLDKAKAGSLHFETLHVRKDGTVFPVEVNTSSAEFGGERLVMSIIRNVTERKRQEKNHEFLLRLSDLIRAEDSWDRLMDGSTTLLGKHLDAGRCYISLVDIGRGVSTVVSEFRADGHDPIPPTTRLVDYSQSNRKAAESGQTIVVSDTARDRRTSRKYLTAYEPARIGSYVAVPLMRDRVWVGTYLVTRPDRYEWSEWEISLIQTLAERTWLAVEKLRSESALRESERRAIEEYQGLLERIVPLAETLGAARELLTIYRALLEFISASMECSGFFVSFYDPERRLRVPAFVWGEGAEIDASKLPPMPITEGGGPNSQAIFGKQTVITNGYWKKQKLRPHVVLRENGIDPMSSLVVPMIVQDRIIGTLEVQAHADSAFHREHAVALEMAANLAAVAVDNVRLIETEAGARAEAEAANRMKDEFLSVLSHELRTPLNAMLGWVRILRGGNVDQERTAKALEIIERNTRQQSSLIEDLLDVSRIISDKMRIDEELIDLVQPLEQVAESFRPIAASKQISFDIRPAQEPLYVKGDVVRLHQVMTNLLQNAIKFTPSGGTVTLEYDREESNAVIRVIDTGVGIEEEFLPLIFDRFSQADASTRRNNTGLGLGLTIVRTIVELHGGSIGAKSDGPGKGSEFTVTIPLADEFYRPETTARLVALTNGNSEALAGMRILVVDDDTDSLLPLRIMLEREKATVICAASAHEAMDHLNDQDFHILISDIGMPSMDGFELIAQLRKDPEARNSDVKAIAYTAYASEEDRHHVLAAGYHVHLAKPLDLDELLTVVRNLGSGIRDESNGR